MDYSALAKCRLFRGLSAEEIERGIGDIPCHVKRYEEGETICPLMAKADQVGIILRGSAQDNEGSVYVFAALNRQKDSLRFKD